MKTLVTQHWPTEATYGGTNLATQIAPVGRRPPIDPRALFLRAYASFADSCRAVDEPGLAVIVADEPTGRMVALGQLRARVDRHTSVIVGRHEQCDLSIPATSALALRQLAVLVSPALDLRRGSSTIRYRILDLRTHDGMVDEDARSLRALRAEGPSIIRCAGLTIFALPLGDPTDWPDDADDAWSMLPQRIYLDELVRVPDASAVIAPRDRDPHAPHAPQRTLVTRVAGPTPIAVRPPADTAGTLELRGPWGSTTLPIGETALREGVLLGRYDRCDIPALAHDESLSRVHALLIEVDDRILLVDTASTNGSRPHGGADARILELADGREYELAHYTVARWSRAS